VLDDFEETLIETMLVMLGASFVDTEHGVYNMIILESGDFLRLDFEEAMLVYRPSCAARFYGMMIGVPAARYGVRVDNVT